MNSGSGSGSARKFLPLLRTCPYPARTDPPCNTNRQPTRQQGTKETSASVTARIVDKNEEGGREGTFLLLRAVL